MREYKKKDGTESVQFGIVLPRDLYRKLRSAADANSLNRSTVIKNALSLFLEIWPESDSDSNRSEEVK